MRTMLGAVAVAALTLLTSPVLAASPLVDSMWMKNNAGKAGIVVLDVRSDMDAYRAGHVPGAIATHYKKDGWRRKKDGVPGMLPGPAQLEQLIGGLGISNADHVVLVAKGEHAKDIATATRIYWTFAILGHDKVSVLNGGMRSYTASGGPVEQGVNMPTPKVFKASFRPELLATEASVKAAVRDGSPQLIDNRPRGFYMGKKKSGKAKRAGTLPGAKSVPTPAMFKPGTMQLLPAETLKAQFEGAGADPNAETIVFCNSGHYASAGWFAQYALLGNKRTKLYDGSMAEWTRDDANPVEIGEASWSKGKGRGAGKGHGKGYGHGKGQGPGK